MKKLIPILIITLGIFVAFPALAVDFYIDSENGHDTTGDGSQETPYKTVEKAFTRLNGGDTVYLKGAFTPAASNYTLSSGESGTAENYTTFSSWPGEEKAVINVAGKFDAFYVFGIDFLKIENLKIYGSEQAGIYIDEYSSNVILENLELYNNDIGIYIWDTEYVFVRNCLIYNNTGGSGYGIHVVWNSQYIDIQNNTFYNNGTADIDSEMSSHYNIENNIFSTTAISLSFDADSQITSDYNDFYNNSIFVNIGSNSYRSLTSWQAVSGQDAHSLNADPIFYKTGSEEDFHLLSASPCIDAGKTISAITDDFDEISRPQGDAYDMGALEWVDYSPKKVKFVKVPKKYRYKKKVKVTWKKRKNADGYNLKLMNKNGKKIKTLKRNTNKRTKYIKKLKPGKTYKVKVRAKREMYGEIYRGKWSKARQFTTKSN